MQSRSRIVYVYFAVVTQPLAVFVLSRRSCTTCVNATRSTSNGRPWLSELSATPAIVHAWHVAPTCQVVISSPVTPADADLAAAPKSRTLDSATQPTRAHAAGSTTPYHPPSADCVSVIDTLSPGS